MTIPEALKELYVALGGDADDVANMSTNPELIAAIATKAGSGLPEVSATDNGDVLTVVEGAWTKAEPSGGAVVIEATLSGGSGNTFTLTMQGKTMGDLSALFSAGKDVIIRAGGNLYRFQRYVAGDKAYFCTAYVPNASTGLLQYSGAIADLTSTSSNVLNGAYGSYMPSTQ